MHQPLEIAFRKLEPSTALEAELRARFAKLARLCGRLIWCRVSVEALHKRHHTGIIYEVHIDMGVPGAELAVTHAPHKVQKKHASADIYTSIREAFQAAERQLKKYNRQRSGEFKHHDVEFFGQVAELHPEGEWGYLIDNTGQLLYFNRAAVLDGSFDALQRGDAVDYIAAEGESGPTAAKVWRKTCPEPQAT